MLVHPAVLPRHDDIAIADPLNAHERIRNLPRLNQTQNISKIIHTLDDMIPDLDSISTWEYTTVAAAMRDIGIFLGSIRRHGVEPTEAIPRLTPLLLRLGQMSSLPPRDGVLHYIPWNCHGDHIRTYTHYPEERILIERTREAYHALDQAALDLQALFDVPLTDPNFGQICAAITASLGELGKSICSVYREVGAAFFVHEIRPYFEPIMVDGVEHRGPGAVELPLFIIDHLLWSSNSTDQQYISFKETYLTTVLPSARDLYNKHKNRPSLLDRVLIELAEAENCLCIDSVQRCEIANQNLEEIKRLFGQLISFRGPHLKLAQQAYELTPDAQFDHGSGGYTPEIVGHVLSLTRHARARLPAAL